MLLLEVVRAARVWFVNMGDSQRAREGTLVNLDHLECLLLQENAAASDRDRTALKVIAAARE